MNNQQLAHLWANQSKESGKGSCFFFNGKTIYSYGHHFPIATLFTHPETGRTCYLYNGARYSVSTSKHQGYVRSAASHLTGYTVKQCHLTSQPKSAAELNEWCNEYRDHAKQKEDQAKQYKRDRARQQRQAKAAREKAIANYPSDLLAWRNGGTLPSLAIERPVALRLIDGGKRIETSKRAIVPSCIAKKAWPILRDAVAREIANPSDFAWQPFFSLPELNWGDYKGVSLRRIALGSPITLTVGCHDIPWDEIELMAQALGIAETQEVKVS